MVLGLLQQVVDRIKKNLIDSASKNNQNSKISLQPVNLQPVSDPTPQKAKQVDRDVRSIPEGSNWWGDGENPYVAPNGRLYLNIDAYDYSDLEEAAKSKYGPDSDEYWFAQGVGRWKYHQPDGTWKWGWESDNLDPNSIEQVDWRLLDGDIAARMFQKHKDYQKYNAIAGYNTETGLGDDYDDRAEQQALEYFPDFPKGSKWWNYHRGPYSYGASDGMWDYNFFADEAKRIFGSESKEFAFAKKIAENSKSENTGSASTDYYALARK